MIITMYETTDVSTYYPNEIAANSCLNEMGTDYWLASAQRLKSL